MDKNHEFKRKHHGTEFKNTALNEACDQVGIKRIFSNPYPPRQLKNWKHAQLTKYLECSDLEWDELLPFTCWCYSIFPRSNGTKPTFFLTFGCEPVEGWLTHLNSCSRYYGDNKGKLIFTELHKLWETPCMLT